MLRLRPNAERAQRGSRRGHRPLPLGRAGAHRATAPSHRPRRDRSATRLGREVTLTRWAVTDQPEWPPGFAYSSGCTPRTSVRTIASKSVQKSAPNAVYRPSGTLANLRSSASSSTSVRAPPARKQGERSSRPGCPSHERSAWSTSWRRQSQSRERPNEYAERYPVWVASASALAG
jgi:hypothetical protein